MKRTLSAWLLSAVLLLQFHQEGNAQTGITVRGQLLRSGPAGYYPAVNVMVRLGNGPPTVTGYDGMYYFYGVPPGVYQLWIQGLNPVPVYAHFPYTDVPQMPVP